MTDSLNPYAAPLANLNPQSSEGGCWSDRNVVVVSKDADLPPRCVKCNAPADTPIKMRTVYWHHPALYIMVIFPGLIFYAIVALIVRKKGLISPGLCETHRRKRTQGLLLGWLSPILGLLIIGFGGSQDNCGLMALGGLLLIGGIVAGMLMARILYAELIDESYVRLKGAGAEFLASLPPFHG